MTALLIVLSVLSVLLVVLSAVACFICYKATIKNFQLQDRMKEYSRFFELITDALETDTHFMRSELIQRLSMEMMETKQLNSAIVKFQNRLEAIKVSLREYKMME